jgi:FKBP-type peptidyl-prolyl cis-trans isomerase FkpA
LFSKEAALVKIARPLLLSTAIAALACGGGGDSGSSPSSSGTGTLVIEDLTVGTGQVAATGNTVTVHYVGTLLNGTKFDSSYDRNQPYTFRLGVGAVIAGWDQGVVGMRVGGKRRLTIPPNLAYGNQANGPIPANSTLRFDIDLLNVQ